MGGKQVGYTSLLFLLENTSELNIEVVAVFENSVSPLATKENSTAFLAKKLNIPLYRAKEKLLDIPEIDFILSIQYGQILAQQEIEKAKIMAVNLHMAPLPDYRGCNQFSFAIIEEAKEFGTTLHQLEPKTDAGAIIFEKRFNILPNEFVTDLYDRTVEASIRLFKEKIKDILEGNFKLVKQESLLDERGCSFHFRNEINNLKKIDASWPLEKQKRYFRATYFPGFEPPVLIDGNSERPLSLEWYNKLP